ncbi:MAG: IPT/TIG domain-containing protein [Acidobacteriota bacterium]|nr:IPT/TIG domain-containing protein [Acidobacteriota bacterium]
MVPSRASAAGSTTLVIHGSGLVASTTVSIGRSTAPVVSMSAGRLLVNAPPMQDGVQDISLYNPADGSASTMPGALTYGAGPSDSIHLISGANPPTAIGGQAAVPMTVRVLAADGSTPVSGASVFFTSIPAASLAACGGLPSCTVLSDLTGQASTVVAVLTAGITTIASQLAPASYPNPQSVQATIVGTSTSLDISLNSSLVWIVRGVTVDVPLKVRVLASGFPLSSTTVNYFLTKGAGAFSVGSATTDSNDYASSTLHIPLIPGDVQASVCVAPQNAPCQTFYGTAVPATSLKIQPISGVTQVAIAGQTFQPVVVGVTDLLTPPHPVIGAVVRFESATGRLPQNAPVPWPTGNSQNAAAQPSMPVILATSQITYQTDVKGVAVLQLSSGIPGPTLTLGTVSIGNSVLPFQLQTVP